MVTEYNAVSAGRSREGSGLAQLVAFKVGKELYGVDIYRIQEVIHYQAITAFPNAPEFIEGAIRLRDRVIPVVDLRKRLGISGEYAGKRRIVILDLSPPLGVIVDDISRVIRVDPASHEDLPEIMINDPKKDCISSLVKTESELILVLTTERILTSEEKHSLNRLERDPGLEEVNASSPY